MDRKSVEAAVAQFRERTAFGKSVEDCFAPWFLHQQFRLQESDAKSQAADGNAYDYGVDAFHLETAQGKAPILYVIQAKFTESHRLIGRGLTDLEKALEGIERTLSGLESNVPQENQVLVSLRAALNRLPPAIRDALELHFWLIHLSEADHEILTNDVRAPKEHLRAAVSSVFEKRLAVIRLLGPRDMGAVGDIIAPAKPQTLRLKGCPLKIAVSGTTPTAEMYYGLGYLADLVSLYEVRRDSLFLKNVRYFIRGEKNTVKGPAAEMQRTLKAICVDQGAQSPPDIFALYHNGVTICAQSAEITESNVTLFDPYILNGCQTVKSAYRFCSEKANKARLNQERWNQVMVPLRILVSRDEALVRWVTINNNRQNSISYAALRANDPEQIRLEERFRRIGIFYERQEGAYSSLDDTNPEILEAEFQNTRGTAVNIVELARSIMAAAGQLTYAVKPSDIFENEKPYHDCFSDQRLASVHLLVFLQNLHDVITLVLKKDLGLERQGEGPRPGSLGYHAMALLMKWLAREQRFEEVNEFSHELWGRRRDFRDRVKWWMDRQSGIRILLKERILSVEDASRSAISDAFERVQNILRLKDVNVFEKFKDFDAFARATTNER